ncbi:MAG: lamin tail domain-containing protein [Proteobacteria bacterium]|nr:lamin tail domain-containing protein [Pseudomonadota bacterium]
MKRRASLPALILVFAFFAAPVQSAPVILNEYNAVDGNSFLANAASDPYWGRRSGNGGDWIELVVIQDGLDMRNWQVLVVNNAGVPLAEESFLLRLTNADLWSNLRSGTIITLSEKLGNNVPELQPLLGKWWVNVRAAADTAGTYVTVECVAPSCDPAIANWKVSNSDSQITIINDSGAVVFGPAGEGIRPVNRIGSTEIFKLEQNPSSAITPTSKYNDGSSSTFGEANVFNAGTSAQNFGALRSVVPFAQLTDIRINEVFTHSDPGIDWVEIYNSSSSPIDVGGWLLSDSLSNLSKYEIPSPTVIPSGGYVVLDQDALLFAFSSACGDQVVLSEAVDGVLTGARDYAEFGAIENGVSFGRFPDAVGPVMRLSEPTYAYANEKPLTAEVIVNEIMYHPPVTGLTINGEFVELYNPSGTTVDLFTDYGLDGVHPWRLTGGVDYNFTLGTSIPADGFLLIVSFDPQLAPSDLADFRNLYGLDPSVVIVGPYTGRLDNFSDTVRMRKPDAPESNGAICGDLVTPGPYVPQVIIDEVEYSDFGDWPAAADGSGASLERSNPLNFAGQPTSWAANIVGSSTPGAPNSTIGPPTRGQQSCMNSLGKDLTKVASDTGKDIGACIKDHARGRLGSLSLAECLVADRKNRIAKSKAKSLKDFNKRCTRSDSGGLPTHPFFGVTNVESFNLAATRQVLNRLQDLVGPEPDTAMVTEVDDRIASRCQLAVVGTATKCADTFLKVFNKCEKSGLKYGNIQNSTAIGACIGSDPRGKIAKVCDPASGKVLKDITKKCVNPGISLASAFPGCAAATASDLAACVNSSVQCRACRGISMATAAIIDCDLFDDGAANGSCP